MRQTHIAATACSRRGPVRVEIPAVTDLSQRLRAAAAGRALQRCGQPVRKRRA